MSTFLIYGAYGFTGKLIARLAVSNGHQPILSGRNAEKTKFLADELGLPWEAFDLTDTTTLKRILGNCNAIINAAGPYSATANAVMQACIDTKCHYIDITGEVDVFELGASLDAKAKEAGICIIPGCGFDVVPTDCMAAWLKSQLPDASHLELAFKGASSISRGTALTMVENIHRGGMIRKDAKLMPVPSAWKTRMIDFGKGPRLAMTIPWGDVSTAYYSTGIPNVMVYLGVNKAALRMARLSGLFKGLLSSKWMQKQMKNYVNKNVKGPSEQLMREARTLVWGEVRNSVGKSVQGLMETPEAYSLTAKTALMALEECLKLKSDPGFKTPSLAFGADFILKVEGVKRWKVS
jgi:short subunit dehydrogenase-like uncharacterized protein